LKSALLYVSLELQIQSHREGKRMTEHIRKRLTREQVRTILDRYLKKEISAEYDMDLLGLKRRQFFKWVKKYRKDYEVFTIEYSRNGANRRISEDIEKSILKELKTEKTLIGNPTMPIRFYNYTIFGVHYKKTRGIFS